MTPLFLIDLAAQRPTAWTSRVLANIGDAKLKPVRMDESAYPEECHAYAKGLLVLDGVMMLRIGGETVRVGSGERYVVPAGAAHNVSAGSTGALLILDV